MLQTQSCITSWSLGIGSTDCCGQVLKRVAEKDCLGYLGGVLKLKVGYFVTAICMHWLLLSTAGQPGQVWGLLVCKVPWVCAGIAVVQAVGTNSCRLGTGFPGAKYVDVRRLVRAASVEIRFIIRAWTKRRVRGIGQLTLSHKLEGYDTARLLCSTW